MRTSEEVYHRVRWDPRFDPARFVLGVRQRGAADKRVPLVSFSPGGDIPWHRVAFVEADGERVWDRAAGLDRLDSGTLGHVRAELRLRAPHFTPRTPHLYAPAAGAWRPATDGPAQPPSGATGLRVLTWNTLWDRYDGDRIDSARRRPMLLAALEAAGADVIALQEVDAGLLRAVLNSPWIRDGYVLAGDPGVRAVEDNGLLLLSRLPLREAAVRPLGPHKALLAATVEAPGGPVVVAVTHLSSDHSPAGADRRTAELALIDETLTGIEGDVVLVGDFNDGGDTPSRTLRMTDAWSLAHGADDATPTFDPVTNPLAAVSSLTGRASRLDRVLLRLAGPAPSAIRLVGELPDADGWFASDHFGLLANLTPGAGPAGRTGELPDAAATARTAVAWIPPRALWPVLDEVRRRHDPSYGRWPPHVNVLFGFVPEARFDDALPLLSAAAAEVPPFAAVLGGLRNFPHRDDATVWLDPAASGATHWLALRQALERRFPGCRGRDGGWTPHLTLGRTRDPDGLAARYGPRIGELPVDVGALALLSRRGDEPFAVRATVALGTGEARWTEDEPPRATPPRPAEAVPDPVARTTALVSRVAAGFGGAAYVVGSRRMGCDGPGADLDLVLALPGAVDTGAVRDRIAAGLPPGTAVREVVGARVPGLRWRGYGPATDLVLVGTGDVPPGEAVAAAAAGSGAAGGLGTIGEDTAIALSAVGDADAIVGAVAGHADAFATLARAVKGWAAARGLDSAPFGGLPGLAWSVLAARTVREDDGATPDPVGLLTRFFGTWAAWDWREPVTLLPTAGATAGAAADPVTVLTPSAPVRSCTAQVSSGMRELLTAELYRAWELLAEGRPPEALGTPPPLHRRHAAWAVLTVAEVPGEEAAVTEGRFRGRVRALTRALEDSGVRGAHAWPRPFAQDTGAAGAAGAAGTRYAVGLGPAPPDASRLTALTHRWAHPLPGVTVRWADGGTVPTLR